MVAVKGFFDGTRVFARQQIPVQEQCEVIITFLNADEMYITTESDKGILSPEHKTTWTDFFSASPCPDFVIDRDMSLPIEKDMF